PRNRNDAGNIVKLSTPRVIASANPRKSENEPSVTISGGNFSRVISHAFKPPAAAPTASALIAANQTGIPRSRQNLPNKIALNPSNDPTERSIPPVNMIGVITSASNPISVLSRSTSKRLPTVAKFAPVALNTATSISNTSTSSASNRKTSSRQLFRDR